MSRSSKLDVIPRDEFYDLYIIKNLSLEEIKDIYNCSIDKIYRYQKLYSLKKTKQQTLECRRRTNLKRYGVPSVMNYEPIKNKYKLTIKKKDLCNVNTYIYNKVIEALQNECNIYVNYEQIYELLRGHNKQLFESILTSFNRKVTFYKIAVLLQCSMDKVYELNRIYCCSDYFVWNKSYYEEFLANHFLAYDIKFEREKVFEGLYGIRRR